MALPLASHSAAFGRAARRRARAPRRRDRPRRLPPDRPTPRQPARGRRLVRLGHPVSARGDARAGRMGERGRAPALPVDRPRAPRRHRAFRARQRPHTQGGGRGCPRRGSLRRRPVRALPTDAAPPARREPLRCGRRDERGRPLLVLGPGVVRPGGAGRRDRAPGRERAAPLGARAGRGVRRERELHPDERDRRSARDLRAPSAAATVAACDRDRSARLRAGRAQLLQRGATRRSS